MKILLANNKQVHNCTVESYLQTNGYQVLTSNSYSDTLQQIEDNNPDVIVADLQAANSTYNIIKNVKTREVKNQIPILVMSGKGQEALVETAFELGADDYVSHHHKLQELALRINILARCRAKAIQ